MVLHHIAQRPGPIIITNPVADPIMFRHGNLDMINRRAVPKRLKQGVRKSKHHQVLNGLLAEIVVDPENTLFGEDRANALIDGPCGGEIGSDRFL